MRLTVRDEYGNADIIGLSDRMPELYAELSFDEANALTIALNKLAEYEDLEEAGIMKSVNNKLDEVLKKMKEVLER